MAFVAQYFRSVDCDGAHGLLVVRPEDSDVVVFQEVFSNAGHMDGDCMEDHVAENLVQQVESLRHVLNREFGADVLGRCNSRYQHP